MMKIASVDAGVNTGVAICHIKHHVEHVILKPEIVSTEIDKEKIVGMLLREKCRIIVLERMPDYGNPRGKEVYNYVLRFYQKGKITHYNSSRGKVAYLVSPSQWKPFMKSRMEMLPESESPHEKDALAMLYYFVLMNNEGRRVVYE